MPATRRATQPRRATVRCEDFQPGRAYAEGTMPLINVTVAHGQTLEEARRRLENAVDDVCSQFGGVSRVQWAADRSRVKLEGAAVKVEMWVDAQYVHATGDLPILGKLLGGPLASGLKQIVQQAFQKKLR